MKHSWFGILLTGIGGFFLMACATSEPKPMTALSVTHPQFKQMCSKCHTLDRVAAAHKAVTDTQMQTIVQRMSKKPDSGIYPSDIQDIVREIY